MRILKEEAENSKAQKDKDRRSEQYFALRSFFQDSWIQVPDGETPSRVMKPRALRQNGSNPPQDNFDKDQDTDLVEHEAPESERVANIPQASAVYVGSFNFTGPRSRSNRSSIQMPYFCFSTCHDEARDKLTDSERIKAYQALLNGYQDSVIHESPTLDEWYYHFAMDKNSAEDKSMRNREQVVTKFLKEQEKTKEVESELSATRNTYVVGQVNERLETVKSGSDDHWTVLRVNQIWIWTFANSALSITWHTDQLADPVHFSNRMDNYRLILLS